MKTILASMAILSITSVVPSPVAAAAANPTGYLEVYQTANCLATEGLEPKKYAVVGAKSGIDADEPYPKGTTVIVRIFRGIDCTKQTLEILKLPADGDESECQNTVFVPNLPAGEGVDVNGMSAQLACIEG